jgi:hypothetical protein
MISSSLLGSRLITTCLSFLYHQGKIRLAANNLTLRTISNQCKIEDLVIYIKKIALVAAVIVAVGECQR